MKKNNVQYIYEVAQKMSDNGVAYRFTDNRWEKRGDIDMIVDDNTFAAARKVLDDSAFTFKSKNNYHRYYRQFRDGELLHLTIKKGGLKRAMGPVLGKRFSPQGVVADAHKSMLDTEQQLFFMIWKKAQGRKISKFSEHFLQMQMTTYNKKNFQQLLRLGFSNADALYDQVIHGDTLEDLSPQVKPKLKHRMAARPWKLFLQFVYGIIRPRPYIAVVGPDGSGKSSTVKKLADTLEANKISVKTFYSGRYKIKYLPIKLKSMPKKVESFIDKQEYKTAKDVTKHKEIREFKSGWIKIVTPLFYYPEYLLRYFIDIFPARRRHIVITDRGFVDIFVSPNSNKMLYHVLNFFMPKPRYILIYNTPEIMHERNSKHPLSDQKRQLALYKKLKKKYWMMVKNDDQDKIVADIFSKIEKLL